MVGAVSEESVMLEWCYPNGSICDSLAFSFSIVAKVVKCFLPSSTGSPKTYLEKSFL